MPISRRQAPGPRAIELGNQALALQPTYGEDGETTLSGVAVNQTLRGDLDSQLSSGSRSGIENDSEQAQGEDRTVGEVTEGTKIPGVMCGLDDRETKEELGGGGRSQEKRRRRGGGWGRDRDIRRGGNEE